MEKARGAAVCRRWLAHLIVRFWQRGDPNATPICFHSRVRISGFLCIKNRAMDHG